MEGGKPLQHKQYWLKLNDFRPYRVDQDRYRTIKQRAGLDDSDEDFQGILTATKQPIQGWIKLSGES
jgi:hypothetical protein